MDILDFLVKCETNWQLLWTTESSKLTEQNGGWLDLIWIQDGAGYVYVVTAASPLWFLYDILYISFHYKVVIIVTYIFITPWKDNDYGWLQIFIIMFNKCGLSKNFLFHVIMAVYHWNGFRKISNHELIFVTVECYVFNKETNNYNNYHSFYYSYLNLFVLLQSK